MGFGVCCHFEHSDRDVWSGRDRDLRAWLALLSAYSGEKLAVVNLSGLEMPEGVTEFRSFDEFVMTHLDEPMVQVELGGKPLTGFQHPAQCWYVFGGTTFTLPEPDVEIDRVNDRVVFHPVHAAHVVLWDRYQKRLT